VAIFWPAWVTPRYPSDRHAFALAPRADEPGSRQDCAAISLSGEIADQAYSTVSRLVSQCRYRPCLCRHRSGVGFEVTDGLEGFPVNFIGSDGPVEMRVVDGSLQLRSPRTASDYVGGATLETGWLGGYRDLVEKRRSVCASRSDQNEDRSISRPAGASSMSAP